MLNYFYYINVEKCDFSKIVLLDVELMPTEQSSLKHS